MAVDIDALKNVIDGIVTLGDAYDTAMTDGKINWRDAMVLGAVVPSVVSVVARGQEAIREAQDLDEQEKAELKAYFVEQFDLDNEQAEKYIELAISILIDFSGLAIKILELRKGVNS